MNIIYALNGVNLFAVCLVILIVIVIVMIILLFRMNKYLRAALSESHDTNELLILSGDNISNKIEALQKNNQSVKKMLSELAGNINFEPVNQNLIALLKHESSYSTEIKTEIERVISLLSVMNDIRTELKSIAGNIASMNENMQKSFSSLQEIGIKAGSLDEGRILAHDLNAKLEEITNAINSLNESIRALSGSGVSSGELTNEQIKVIDNLNKSIDNLAKFAANMQGAITKHNGSIESTFVKTEDSLRRLIMNVTDRIEKDYRDNLEVMFKAMDKNLRAILDRLINDIDKKKK